MSFEKQDKGIVLIGKIASGTGQGRHYMSLPGYRKQFIEKLGIDPFYGTLNIELNDANVKKLERIEQSRPVLVEGFEEGGQTYGDVLCYMAELQGIRCALVIPKRSMHKNMAEIISSNELRVSLGLKDGAKVKVSVKI